MANGSTRPTKIAKITEFCYETAHNPSTVNWKLRCLDDEGSERRCLLRLRCVPAGLRGTSCLCRPTSGRRCSTSCRCRSSTCSCRRSAPKSLLTIAYQVGIGRASSQRRTLIIEICAVHESPIGRFCCKSRLLLMGGRPIHLGAMGFDPPTPTLSTQLLRYAMHRASAGGGRATRAFST